MRTSSRSSTGVLRSFLAVLSLSVRTTTHLLISSVRMSSVPTAKKNCVSIGTHNGAFHCDEALACYMLRLLPEYKDARIVRTRDPTKLAPCDIVVDVGGEYDHSKNRYDHHQKTFTGTMNSLTNHAKPWTTKLSSAGLVYLHFGKRVIEIIAGASTDPATTEELYDRAYINFVEEVDAVDNGINDRDGEPRYKITSTISHRVGHLNPAWNDSSSKDPDVLFEAAMELVGGEFVECVRGLKNHWLPAREIVKEAIVSRLETAHRSGFVIKLSRGCPWKEHLFALESELKICGVISFVLYQESDSDKWRVQAVPVHTTGFNNRVSLHKPWCGLRDEELCKASGIPGCVFAHASGFIGGNHTYEGALKMAIITLQKEGNISSNDLD